MWTVLVDRPADVGLEPVQGKIEEKKTKRRLYSNASTGGLYALLLAAILMGMNSSPASSHLTLNFTTDGFDAMVVARAISLYGFTLILAKLVYGQVVDKLGSKTAVLFFGFLIILARIMCWAATYTDSISFLFLTLFIYGSGVPIETLGYPNWCADLTSSEMYPKVITKLQMGYQLGTLLGSPLPGIFYDFTGSYSWYYFISSIAMLIAFIAVTLTYRKSYISMGKE